jgi:hypothetical protein
MEAALRLLAARMPGDTDVEARIDALFAQLHDAAH